MNKTFKDTDGKYKCHWCSQTEAYIKYHDLEWGHSTLSDQELFEKLTLESFQSGLSWLTILNKRANFKRAFKSFNIQKVSKFTENDILILLQNEGIVRHRGKIEAAVNNANQLKLVIKEFGSFKNYLIQYTPNLKTSHEVRSRSPESETISKDLRKRGFKFVGPTTIYSFMQAIGMVNDHSPKCFKFKTFKSPFTAKE